MKQFIKGVLSVVLIALVAACSGGGSSGSGSGTNSSTPAPAAPSVTGIAISPADPTIAFGSSPTLTAHLVFSDGKTKEISNPSAVDWSSSNRFVLNISTAGVITTGFRGQSTVTASYQTFQASALVTVVPALSRIYIDADLSSVPPLVNGQPSPAAPYDPPTGFENPPEFGGQLFAIAEYNDTGRQDITADATWSMADPTIATVSNNPGTKGLTAEIKSGITTVSIGYKGFTAQAIMDVLPIRLLGKAGIPFGSKNGLLNPMATVDGLGKVTAAWSFQLTGEVFTGGHDGHDWTDRVQINAGQSPTDEAIISRVESNDAGDRLIVWYGTKGIYASYAKAGEAFGAVKTIPQAGVASFQTVDAAVVTTSGEAIVLWTTTGPRHVYMNRFDPATGTWSEPTDLGIAIPSGRAAFNKNGDAVLAWQELDTSTNEYSVHGAIYVNGSGIDAVDTLSTLPSTEQPTDIDLAINTGREAVVTWASAAAAGSSAFPRVAQYSAVSDSWYNKMSLPAGSAGSGSGTRAAINDSGDVFVAWADTTSSGLMYANRFTTAGGWETADALTTNISVNTPRILSLAVTSSGNAICFFAQAVSFGAQPFKYRRYIKGTGWGALTEIDDPGSVGNPNLSLQAAYNANGKGVLFWEEAGDLPDGSGGVYFVDYDFMELGPDINP